MSPIKARLVDLFDAYGCSPLLAAGATGVAGSAPTAAVSRSRKAPSSWIVLISGAGKMTVEFLSTAISTSVCRLRSCSASGWAIITSDGVGQLAGGERLALGGDDLGALLALGLGLTGHRALHALGQLDVLELDDRDLHAPLLGLDVEDLADVLVDRRRSRTASRPACGARRPRAASSGRSG